GHTAEGLTFGHAASTHVTTAPGPPLRSYVEQDRVQTLLDRLRTADFQAAALELLQHGPSAIPALVDALAWRDMEMRRRAFAVLQPLWPGVGFDPFAPEPERALQLAQLRARL